MSLFHPNAGRKGNSTSPFYAGTTMKNQGHSIESWKLGRGDDKTKNENLRS